LIVEPVKTFFAGAPPGGENGAKQFLARFAGLVALSPPRKFSR
jgi:hypothetical protein